MSITPNRNQVLFRQGNVELVSRLIEGQFPPYERIIPAATENRVVVSTGEFLNANRTAAIFARDNSNIVRLQFTPGEEGLTPGKLTLIGHQRRGGRQRGRDRRRHHRPAAARSRSTAATWTSC